METMNTISNFGDNGVQTNQIGELMGALAKAQGKIASAVKSKLNPFFKSKYADLPAIWEACKEPLASNGLSIVQTIEGTVDQMYLTTILGHSSGQWIKSKIPLILIKKDPQAMGTSITYARRYALAAMVGVCGDDEDDDAEAAAKEHRKKEKEEEELKKKEEETDYDQLSIDSLTRVWEIKLGSEFPAFLETIRQSKKMNYKKCFQAFDKRPEYTEEQFKAWLLTNATIPISKVNLG